MPADPPSGFPFPADQDPDRTVSYRTPQHLRAPEPGMPANPPTMQYAQWQQPEELGYAPGYNMAPPPTQPPKKRGVGWIIAIVAAVLVGVVAGGAVWAVAKLSGGGTQPHEVLPGNAIAYVRLDLDPAANQKLALFAIARKFSATKDAFAGDDPREALFEAIKGESPDLAKVDYAKDVEPWLGDRIGVAMLPPAKDGAEPGVAVAVQVKDEDAARTGIARLSTGEDAPKLAFRDGYAILAQTQAEADAYAKGATLADNASFSGDLDALGEPGVLSFWADLGKVVQASGMGQSVDAAVLSSVQKARFAGALRFDGSYAELTGRTFGIDSGGAKAEPTKISELPASTVAAVSVSGIGEMIGKQWPQIKKTIEGTPDGEAFNQIIDQAKQQYGLILPDDLVTLLGKSLTVALDEENLDTQPNFGAVLATDPARGQGVLQKLERLLSETGTPVQLAKAPGDGKLVVASSQGYAAKLAAAGKLGESETFNLAIPNAGNATFALYADLDKLEKLYLGELTKEEQADAKVLRGIGLSGTYSGDQGEFTLRVLFN